ncbi:replication-associated protein RepX, partial [Lactococcus petauri]|nr:replication-associated protein RepX [Lactococcus petauri]
PPTQAPTADKEPPTQAPTADKEPPTQAPTADVVFLQNELVKRGVEIDKLHELLDQQQRLALQDKKLLDEYKSEINELKSLMLSVREDEKDPEVHPSKDINKIKEKPQKKNKKWWHFGRM